jgi:hypothetical protein
MNLPGFYFGENIPQLLTYYVPVSGGVRVGGTSPASYSFTIWVPSGGAVVAGTSPVTHIQIQIYAIAAPTGGVSLAGSAGVSELLVSIFTIAPSGGVVVGGAATVTENIPFIPARGAVVGGSAVVREAIPYTPSGGVVVGGTSEVLVLAIQVPMGGVVVGGAAPLAVVYLAPPSGGVVLGGGATISDYRAWYAPSGGVVIGGAAVAYLLPSGATVTTANPLNRDFPGWAINAESNVPSRYARLPANSICQFNGVTYVANAGGIYSLDGDDDDGAPIRTCIDLGLTDYGSEANKRIPEVYIAIRTPGKMRLGIETNKTEGRFYYALGPSAKLVVNRVTPGRGLEGRYWHLQLANVDGCDFELESLAFTPLLLKRSGR